MERILFIPVGKACFCRVYNETTRQQYATQRPKGLYFFNSGDQHRVNSFRTAHGIAMLQITQYDLHLLSMARCGFIPVTQYRVIFVGVYTECKYVRSVATHHELCLVLYECGF